MPVIPYDATRVALNSPAKRPSVLASGTNYDLTALSVEFARLAYLHCEVAGIDRDSLEKTLAEVNFGALEIFSDDATDTHGFGVVREIDGVVIVAFRGTDPTQATDIATDLDLSTVVWPESAGQVHQGFACAARAVRQSVEDWLDSKADACHQLILCGHSLGGAIATLIASIRKPDRLITIGCPRVGDKDFVETLSAVELTRFVDCCDVVTQLPPELFGYIHAGKTVYIDQSGTLVGDADDSAIEKDQISARAAYLLEYSWRTGDNVLRDLADHAPINYVRALID